MNIIAYVVLQDTGHTCIMHSEYSFGYSIITEVVHIKNKLQNSG